MVMAQRRSPTTRPQPRLDREAWATQALTVLAANGLAAVAIEPIAKQLGATKGSFYWHFRDRADLVDAALALHEERATEAVITALAAEPDPTVRLRTLFDRVLRSGDPGLTDLALLASADDPQVAPVLDRITHRRIGYLAEMFGALGEPRQRAHSRAVLAYTAYIGLLQAQRATAYGLFSSARQRNAYLDFLLPAISPPV